MVRARENSASGGLLERSPSTALVIGGHRLGSVRRGACDDAVRPRRPGGNRAAAARVRLARAARRVAAAHRRPHARGAGAGGPLRAGARSHEPELLRRHRSHPARDRGRARVRRAADRRARGFAPPPGPAVGRPRRGRHRRADPRRRQRARRPRRRRWRSSRVCCWGTYILLNARLGRAFEGGTGLALAMCVGTIAVAPIGIVEGAGEPARAPKRWPLGAAVGILLSSRSRTRSRSRRCAASARRCSAC